MQSTHVLRGAWSLWHSCVGSGPVAMVLALVFCYQSLYIAFWIVKVCKHSFRSTSSEASGSELGVQRYQNSQELFLSLFYTMEVPLIASYHPMIPNPSCVCEANVVPSDYQLICQTLVFVTVDYLMHPFFLKYYPLYSIEEPMNASGLATDITVQQAILVLAIGVIQWSNRGGYGEGFGQLHIVAIAGWVLFQQLSKSLSISWPRSVAVNPSPGRLQMYLLLQLRSDSFWALSD